MTYMTNPGGGGGGAGTVLASVRYLPASLVTYNINSTTPAVADATNLTISFTAPSSGAVEIYLEALGFGNVQPANLWWGVGVHGGSVTLPSMCFVTGSVNAIRCSATIKITGLTGGNSYQYDWYAGADAVSGVGTCGFYAGGNPTSPLTSANAGQATMIVWSA